MKINKMNVRQVRCALYEARKNCPGSRYEADLKNRLRRLKGK